MQCGTSLSGADPEESGSVRIPFRIDDGIAVRPAAGSVRVAACRVVGAVHGQFILITEPAVKISEKVSIVLDETFLCSYFCNGYLYTFHSRYRNCVMNDIVCIEYPREVEVRQIRKDRRVKVNIETKVSARDSGDSFLADMTDISRGGCRLVFNQQIGLAKGVKLSLTFSLPNEALIKKLDGQIVRLSRVKDSKTTEAGVSFCSEGGEISKVVDFCEFCMYFDMD